MALRLRIVSEHARILGEGSTKVFGVHGGTIGRSTDNEWILPDPERYLSGKHARVDFRAGTYVLVDTSSNGTYVNGQRITSKLLTEEDFISIGRSTFHLEGGELVQFVDDELDEVTLTAQDLEGRPLTRELAGYQFARRGAYRVVYGIDDAARVVHVVRIDHRSSVYRTPNTGTEA